MHMDVQGNWGVGMMAMPFMLDQCGPISGVIMFIASMALTQFSILNLLYVAAGTLSLPVAVGTSMATGCLLCCCSLVWLAAARVPYRCPMPVHALLPGFATGWRCRVSPHHMCAVPRVPRVPPPPPRAVLRSVKRALETSHSPKGQRATLDTNTGGADHICVGAANARADTNARHGEDDTAHGHGHGSYRLDYTEIMGRALGGHGEWGALFCIIMSQYGSAIAYVQPSRR